MSADNSKQSMPRTIFWWTTISLVVIAATWFAVIAWWELTEHLATTADVLLYLIALPVGIPVLIGWLRWWLSSYRKSHRKRAHAAPAQTHVAVADAPLFRAEDANAAAPNLPILAAWVATALDSEGNEFANNLAQRRLRPTPDELLTDREGFPPLTGRVTGLDTAPVVRILTKLCADRIPVNEIDADGTRITLLRALALLESVLQQAAQEWPLDTVANTGMQTARNDRSTLRGSAGLPKDEDTPIELHVKLLLSDTLTPTEKVIARAFAEERLLALGICAPRQPVEVVATTDDATALKLLDAFRVDMLAPSGARTPQALLLLACDSALCPATIDNWEAQGRLFSVHCPNGLMPGEGAFAILCANTLALQAAAAFPICCMTVASTAQRGAGSDRQTAHACLTELIGATLSDCGIDGDAIGTVVCDADHRTGATLESIEAMLSQMPHLDAIENRLSVNETCGHLGAASIPAALAAAAIRSSDADHPVLIFNVGHASERAAAVLLPADTDRRQVPVQSSQGA